MLELLNLKMMVNIWNATRTAQIIARNTLDALCAIDPVHVLDYEMNFHGLGGQLLGLRLVVEFFHPKQFFCKNAPTKRKGVKNCRTLLR